MVSPTPGGAGAHASESPSPSAIPAPRPRILTRIGIPIAVASCVGGLILASAWESLAPAHPVHVVPAVFDRTDEAPASSATNTPTTAPTQSVQAPGWLEAEPFAIACTGLADGIVESVLVLEGEPVEQGQIVAQLVAIDAELALARAEADTRAAEANAAIASAELRAAQTDWDEPVERERAVAATRADLAETQAELAQLPSLVAGERAALERLTEEHNRAKQALESGAANQIEEIIARKRVDEQRALLESVERRGAILEARRDRLTAEVEAATRNASLRIEERRALDAAIADSARAEAALAEATARRDEARLRLERMTIRSPITGYVQRRLKAPGDKLMLGMDDPTSAQVALVYDPAKLQVRVDVPLADASLVRIGQACEVVVDVLPDRTFRGEVLRMTNEADLQKNTVQVKVRVIDPDPLLRPEMLTRVKFLGSSDGARSDAPLQSDDRAVRVPDATIAQGPAGAASVWVVRDRRGAAGIARREAVDVESIEAGWSRVRGAVRAGDLLIVGDDRLREGQRVRLISEVTNGGAS